MNRAKKPGGSSIKRYSNETQRYLDDAQEVLARVARDQGLKVKLLNAAIFDKVGMKRAIQEGLPTDFGNQFQALWREIQAFLQQN